MRRSPPSAPLDSEDRSGAPAAVSTSGGPWRIHAVAALTGIPEPTLRAWERRYGVPTPKRTASGYRLYGAPEIEQVRAMRRLCDEGMAAAEAARLVGSAAVAPPSDDSASSVSPDVHREAVRGLIAAIADLDDIELEKQIRRTLCLGSGMQLFDRVLAPTLVRIGQLWHEGQLSVAQEHFGTRRISTLVEDLTRLAVDEASTDAVVVACFADELHEVGALGLAMRFATWGWRPIVLGARTPPDALRTAVDTVAPKLVALSLTVVPERERARELVDGYASACGAIPWILGGKGGSAIADLVRRAGGIVAPPDVPALRALVRDAAKAPGSD